MNKKNPKGNKEIVSIIIELVTQTKKIQMSSWERLLMLVKTAAMLLPKISLHRRTQLKTKWLTNSKTSTYLLNNHNPINNSSSRLINNRYQAPKSHSNLLSKPTLIFLAKLSTCLKLSSLLNNSSHIWLVPELTGPQSSNSFYSNKCYGNNNSFSKCNSR